MAAKMSAEEGIAYRFGPVPQANQSGLPTWFERPNSPFTAAQRPAAASYLLGDWQVGGPLTQGDNPGDYFSNGGNSLYVADSTDSVSVGVSTYISIMQQSNVFIQRPQLSWVFGGGGANEANATALKVKNPVAMARCHGNPGWCQQVIVAYQDGTLASAVASNNSLNSVSTKLAANKVPTAIAVTNGGEFALVTVWDTSTSKAQVAVVALAGLCNGCTVAKPDKGDVGWGEWGAVNPGLPNFNDYGFIKVLGYVDLPDNMRAPTAITVTTGWNPWNGRVRDASGSPSSYYRMPLDTPSARQTYVSGTNVNAYARTGVAVVLSKEEKRAAFIDLKPLLAYYQKMYFGTDADFASTRKVGAADNVWPFTFTNVPAQKPTFIKTIDLGATPLSAKSTLWGPKPHAWIGTQEGKLLLANLGNYAQSAAGSTLTAKPDDIQIDGSVTLDGSLTGVSYFFGNENDSGNMDIHNQAIVVSRSARKIFWVNFNSDHNGGTIQRTLQDTRLLDPIDVEDNPAHGTQVSVVTVADYTGRAVRNYRYSNIIFWTNQGNDPFGKPYTCQPNNPCRMGQSGTDPFEYGGAFPHDGSQASTGRTYLYYYPKGKPFMVSSSNVP